LPDINKTDGQNPGQRLPLRLWTVARNKEGKNEKETDAAYFLENSAAFHGSATPSFYGIISYFTFRAKERRKPICDTA
jgi:hypothetical protein